MSRKLLSLRTLRTVLRYLPIPPVVVVTALAFGADTGTAAALLDCGWHNNYDYEHWPFFYETHAGQYPGEDYYYVGEHHAVGYHLNVQELEYSEKSHSNCS